jgi:hypothetical protein
MERRFTRVTCYSGGTYADRPTSIVWGGVALAVTAVETEWREPGERLFRVRIEDGLLLELCYHEGEDRWSAVEVVSKSQKGGRDEQRGS